MFVQIESRELSMPRCSQTSGGSEGNAAMVELVDTRDLKSLGRKAVRVRVPLAAPLLCLLLLLPLLVSCGGKSGYFKMEGRFLHINQGELYVYSPDGGIKDMDTIRIEAGRFAYQTPMEKASTLILVFPNFSQHPVFAEPGGSVDIKADASHLKEMTVKGTDDNELMNDFREQILNASPVEEVDAAERFISDHPGSRVSYYLFQKYFMQTSSVDIKRAFRILGIMEAEKKSDIPALDLTKQRQYLNSQKAMAVGAVLPTFSARDIEGNNVSSSDYKKGIAVICTWASWSYTSLDQLRTLRDFHREHADLRVFGICLDGSKVECKNTIERQMLEGTFVCDEQMTEGRLYRQLGLGTVPNNIILKNGKILACGLDNKSLRERLEKLLK